MHNTEALRLAGNPSYIWWSGSGGVRSLIHDGGRERVRHGEGWNRLQKTGKSGKVRRVTQWKYTMGKGTRTQIRQTRKGKWMNGNDTRFATGFNLWMPCGWPLVFKIFLHKNGKFPTPVWPSLSLLVSVNIRSFDFSLITVSNGEGWFLSFQVQPHE